MEQNHIGLRTNYPFELLNSGQTGVERGAYLTADALAIPVSGVMRTNGRDELGAIPPTLAGRLCRCPHDGPRRAREANVQGASIVLLAVPDTKQAARVTGMAAVMRTARIHDVPLLTCDPGTNLDAFAISVMTTLRSCAPHRIYIVGPRATRWSEGEDFGRALVRILAVESQRFFGNDLVVV